MRIAIMELKTLWLGLVLSMAAFAVKTGLGWAYLWQGSRAGKRLGISAAVVALYAVVFAALAFLVSRINLLAHYETLSPLWRNGVTLHWLTAIMLLLWGIVLLRRPADARCHSTCRGWLALVIPCPVCLSVILMATAALHLYFPEHFSLATAGLFLAFMLIASVGGLATILNAHTRRGSAESALGMSMLMMAAYFMLSALIAPQFAELGRVYRLSAYAADGGTGDILPKVLTVVAILVLFAIGFVAGKKRIEK